MGRNFVVCMVLFVAASGAAIAVDKPIPIILDTDIGSDVDDAFAVALILGSPELDLVGVTTVSGDTQARARLAAKMLWEAGKRDVPVAAGEPGRTWVMRTPSFLAADFEGGPGGRVVLVVRQPRRAPEPAHSAFP